MPSLIGAAGTNVAANYLKAAASTNFGTRQLSVIKIEQANVYTNYANANSLFSKSVRALQQTAEVYGIFAPADASPDYFCAIIATDTQWDGVGAPQTSQGGAAGDASFDALEASIANGSGVSATVTLATLS